MKLCKMMAAVASLEPVTIPVTETAQELGGTSYVREHNFIVVSSQADLVDGRKEKKRLAALAKLSPEEKEILRLS